MSLDSQILHELRAIRRRQTALLFAVCGIIVWLGAITFAADVDIVRADQQSLPQAALPYTYYFTTERVAPEYREQLAKVLAFTVVSCNSQTVVENQLPQHVAGGVYRIDIRLVGWDGTLPAEIIQHYPYSSQPGRNVAMIRADWFVQWALDQTRSDDFYHRLIFGRGLKNQADFLNLVGADDSSPYEFGWVEDQSGVANAGTRLLTTLPTNRRSDCWVTYDFEEITTENDPLEHPGRDFQHDASEIIGAIPKTISSTGQTGLAQIYALANGEGVIQNVAPTSIVTDHSGVRGVEIINPVSCIVCHEEGLRPPSKNAVREFLKSGAEIYADYKTKEDIERFHFSDIERYRIRANEDYSLLVAAVTGWTTKQNAVEVHRVFQRYDAKLTLDDAARELNADADELKLALAAYGKLPARMAQLAHGQPIARTTWESEYRLARLALESWRSTQ